MTEECTLEFDQGGLVRLAGALTFDTCAELYSAMERHLHEGGKPERIDLAGVNEADSAGLALLLEWQAVSRTSGRVLGISSAPDSVVHMARLCDAVELLNLTGKNA